MFFLIITSMWRNTDSVIWSDKKEACNKYMHLFVDNKSGADTSDQKKSTRTLTLEQQPQYSTKIRSI